MQFTGARALQRLRSFESVVYTGDFTRTFDYATGVLRLDGLDSHAVMPGNGVIELNAGDSTFSPADVIVRGPDGNVTELCNALS